MKITILGGGSWGTALAVHLAKNNHDVKVWEFFEEQAKEMQEKRKCPLLPEVKLSDNIFISSKMEEVLPESELILLVVPSDKVEITVNSAKQFLDKQPIVICSKGLGKDLKLLSDIVKESVKGNVYCLYGPTHAEEVCKGIFSGIVLAGKDSDERNAVKKAIQSPSLKVELSEDLVGVQISAALKNIIAVFVGVLDGKGLGDNTKAFVVTKGLEEIKLVGLKLGAKEETFYGLAGLGDVFVTATSEHSRNRFVGEQVGKGRKLDEVTKEMKMIAEGITTIKESIEFKDKLNLKLPLIEGLYKVLFEGRDVEDVLKEI